MLVLASVGCGERAQVAAASGRTAQSEAAIRGPKATSEPTPIGVRAAPIDLPSTDQAAPVEPVPNNGSEAVPTLSIQPRKQSPESPASGWCGETAIQEALLYFGVWAPQRTINRAGKPKHPDLYSSDIPVALTDLGLRFEFYAPRKGGFAPYLAWIRAALDAGEPVLSGVKLMPTQHPEWGLDHFVLVVGYGPRGLLVNTTWGHREWADDTIDRGISFKNVTYGIRLRGVTASPNGVAARLSVVAESEQSVTLRILCDGLSAGAAYRLERRRSRSDKQPHWSEPALASDGRVAKTLAIPAAEVAIFSCAPLGATDSVGTGPHALLQRSPNSTRLTRGLGKK
jgi:hypothetical protein